MRSLARRWAFDYCALASLSPIIRDRCPKPSTCRATALSGATLLVTGHGSGRSYRHASRVANIYCGRIRASYARGPGFTNAVDAPASGTCVATPSILPPHARTVVLLSSSESRV